MWMHLNQTVHWQACCLLQQPLQWQWLGFYSFLWQCSPAQDQGNHIGQSSATERLFKFKSAGYFQVNSQLMTVTLVFWYFLYMNWLWQAQYKTNGMSKVSVWPSGLRRWLQVPFYFGRRGFEPLSGQHKSCFCCLKFCMCSPFLTNISSSDCPARDSNPHPPNGNETNQASQNSHSEVHLTTSPIYCQQLRAYQRRPFRTR